MFEAFLRRGRQVRKSSVASAVIPVVEALDPRKLLSAEGQAVEPAGDTAWCLAGDRTLHVPASDDVAVQRHLIDIERGEWPVLTYLPVETEPLVETEPPPVVEPPVVTPLPVIASAPRGVVVEEGWGGTSVQVYGTDGDDNIVIEYDEAAGGIRVNGVAGVEDGTLFTGIWSLSVYAGDGDDTVTLTCGPEILAWIYGGAGDDHLAATGVARGMGFSGNAGNDTLLGSDGGDQFYGGAGNDSMDGGGGDDRLMYEWFDLTAVPEIDLANGIVFNDGYGFSDTVASVEAHNAPSVNPNRVIQTPEGASKATGGIVIRFNHMYVFGTDGDDVISIVSGPGKNEVQVSGVPGVRDGTVFNGIETITLEAGDGDDVVTLDWGDPSLGWINGFIYGEAGDDTLRAINGTQAALFGGEGNDAYLLPLLYSGSVQDDSGESTVETYDFTGGKLPRMGGLGPNGGISVNIFVMTLYGTPGDDNFRIEAVPGGVRIYGLRGLEEGTMIPEIGWIEVHSGDGDDTISIDLSNSTKDGPVRVFGGDGTDTLRVTGKCFYVLPSDFTGTEHVELPSYPMGISQAPITPPAGDQPPTELSVAALSRKAVAAKKAALTRKQKLLAKQKKLKQLKLKQAKLAARKAALAEERAEARLGGRGF